jgi:hypothetical protein
MIITVSGYCEALQKIPQKQIINLDNHVKSMECSSKLFHPDWRIEQQIYSLFSPDIEFT